MPIEIGITGKFILTFDKDKIVYQGEILGQVEPGHYLVQLFSSINSGTTHNWKPTMSYQAILDLGTDLNCEYAALFDSAEAMHEFSIQYMRR